MAYVNVRVSRHLKEELAWAIDKWLPVISNKMLTKTVIPLKTKEKTVLNLTKILVIPFQLCLNITKCNCISR